MFFLGRGTHITRDMFFLGRGTHITRDMCFQGSGAHVSRVGEHSKKMQKDVGIEISH